MAGLGAEHRFIHAGRPQTNGCVERVQRTILDECWKPAFARYLIPNRPAWPASSSGSFVTTTPTAPHNGRYTRGRIPDAVLGKAKMFTE